MPWGEVLSGLAGGLVGAILGAVLRRPVEDWIAYHRHQYPPVDDGGRERVGTLEVDGTPCRGAPRGVVVHAIGEDRR